LKVLVTGGAGFIGRGVVKRLLDEHVDTVVLDDLSNGKESNIAELRDSNSFGQFVIGDVKDTKLLSEVFEDSFDVCFHLAASIVVQDSIDNPQATFENDVIGTFNVLEACRLTGTKIVFTSTCMVYDTAKATNAINETHPVKAVSPYAGSKLAGEYMIQSYFYTYNLPMVIIRPFNTYGPFQKSSGEGGVVAIFTESDIQGRQLQIYGDGTQTRDLLYVDDCAKFIVTAGLSEKAIGHTIGAGYGKDISINELATMICDDSSRIVHVKHIHPQSEIMKLVCDNSKAKQLLGWEPRTSLEEGLVETRKWISESIGAS
jgi:nucleoside-diphosphate-sugar epimerase